MLAKEQTFLTLSARRLNEKAILGEATEFEHKQLYCEPHNECSSEPNQCECYDKKNSAGFGLPPPACVSRRYYQQMILENSAK